MVVVEMTASSRFPLSLFPSFLVAHSRQACPESVWVHLVHSGRHGNLDHPHFFPFCQPALRYPLYDPLPRTLPRPLSFLRTFRTFLCIFLHPSFSLSIYPSPSPSVSLSPSLYLSLSTPLPPRRSIERFRSSFCLFPSIFPS